jgi:hypothetical protein
MHLQLRGRVVGLINPAVFPRNDSVRWAAVGPACENKWSEPSDKRDAADRTSLNPNPIIQKEQRSSVYLPSHGKLASY